MDQDTLPIDFAEFSQALNEEKVDYLLIGGWAVGIHGYARYTGDIDFWYARDPGNAQRIIAALRRFGVDDPGVTISTLMDKGRILRMGKPPLRIELLNEIDGVEFEPCHARRFTAVLDGIEIPVISREDLVINKRASKRPKDHIDADELEG